MHLLWVLTRWFNKSNHFGASDEAEAEVMQPAFVNNLLKESKLFPCMLESLFGGK